MSARIRNTAPVFAALGDETRLRVVARLAGGAPQSIAGLTAGTGITRQAVTKHLRVLEQAGLVRGLRRGRERLWQLRPEQLLAARRHLEIVSRQWDDALARLKASIEGGS